MESQGRILIIEDDADISMIEETSTTLEVPQEPLGIMNFNVYACAIGIALVVGMQVYRNHVERRV